MNTLLIYRILSQVWICMKSAGQKTLNCSFFLVCSFARVDLLVNQTHIAVKLAAPNNLTLTPFKLLPGHDVIATPTAQWMTGIIFIAFTTRRPYGITAFATETRRGFYKDHVYSFGCGIFGICNGFVFSFE